jgi:hypothetical protein
MADFDTRVHSSENLPCRKKSYENVKATSDPKSNHTNSYRQKFNIKSSGNALLKGLKVDLA